MPIHLHGQGTTGAWYGIWNSVYPYHHLTQAVVQYEAVPPFVEQLPNFSDTWAEEKEIWADVVDLDGDAFSCTLMLLSLQKVEIPTIKKLR
ncbi:MAG: hypothetical protein CM1200mP10_03550 [Candidatus Neomarinimicrobiota bacterium]|nr:MAG: hypothetical protein CM1200mP10_03550 [Candidatus Neomarinimicrobiota bacterium]